MSDVDLYNMHYGHLAADVQTEVRRDTYDDDLGQSSWITLAEAREWFRQLRLDAGSRVLEVACGSGGITRHLAAETGASAVGVDINPHGIDAATASAARSSIGFYLFVPAGGNERLLEQAGFAVREVRDVTDAEASISSRWRDARARRRDALVTIEGQDGFEGLQRFLDMVCVLSRERRLSRFAYLADR
jgi:SAM-dependent methyltransferase